MNSNGYESVSLDEVKELLRQQAEVFKVEMEDIKHKLEMAQRNSDAQKRMYDAVLKAMPTPEQHAAISNAMPTLEQNVNRTLTLKQNVQELSMKSTEKIDDLETIILGLKAQASNSAVEIARLYDHLTTQGLSTAPMQNMRIQQDHMRALITDLEQQQARTNARHASEGSIACNCAHKTMNEKMAKMAHRISSVR
ncbi:hypothetical protein CONLIGDRAFT_646418 [Coniochaeta ligniaria NRRL 30616]|uniref:Uncharacterized protein n=1 Tax=Coniochaeta ligniaria NRRL 30616 TaxID=1408157 RepID=A0A1J7IYS0_9PEZI|nr:hypothetical protein CONLIGDRAFT_646418 [Coniochaeta ligniaria NRRL 30616]